MLKSSLLHPEILNALAGAGHGSQILIADGNYPVSTTVEVHAQRVYLNLAPGLVSVTDVLKALVTAIPIEAAEVMTPPEGPEPAIFAEFRNLLPADIILQKLERFAFYAAAGQPTVCLSIGTGEQRIYANLLLTIGVVLPE